jgi:hypothetical protein
MPNSAAQLICGHYAEVINMTMKHRTKDGQILELTEMTDRHLQNTIALYQRKLKPYVNEAKRRKISIHPPVFLKMWRWGKRNVFQLIKKKKHYVSGYADIPFGHPIDGEEAQEMYQSMMY